MKPYSGSSTALVQAHCGRNSAALASSFSIARRRTSAASSRKPSSSPLKRSRVIMAAGGLVGLGADEHAEIGIERHGALGQQTLHRVGLDVGIVLELVPHRELRGVIGAEGEGGDDIEADVAVAVGVEQFRRELAEAQALLDMPFGGAEALGDLVDRHAAVDQCGHGDKFVGRVHRGADRVFDERGFDARRRRFRSCTAPDDRRRSTPSAASFCRILSRRPPASTS